MKTTVQVYVAGVGLITLDLWCDEKTGMLWDRIQVRPGQPTLNAEQSARAKVAAAKLARGQVQSRPDEFASVFRQIVAGP